MPQIILEAPDISCDHCIHSIQKAMNKLPCVTFISGDPDSKRVVLDYDPATVSIEQIEGAMEEEGYPVRK